MLSPLKETDCGRGSPDLKTKGWLCCLEEGMERERLLQHKVQDCVCTAPLCICRIPPTLHAEEVAGHFPFICLGSWILQVNVSLSRQAAADQR